MNLLADWGVYLPLVLIAGGGGSEWRLVRTDNPHKESCSVGGSADRAPDLKSDILLRCDGNADKTLWRGDTQKLNLDQPSFHYVHFVFLLLWPVKMSPVRGLLKTICRTHNMGDEGSPVNASSHTRNIISLCWNMAYIERNSSASVI